MKLRRTTESRPREPETGRQWEESIAVEVAKMNAFRILSAEMLPCLRMPLRLLACARGSGFPPRSILPLLCLFLVGCGSSSGIRIGSGDFDAMPVQLETQNDQWLVVFTAPTGGWQARFDTERPMFNGREAFITITAPDPDAFNTQALTDLHVLTPVAIENAIDVYARVAPFRIKDGEPEKGWGGFFKKKDGSVNPPYQRAASASGI